MNWCKIIDESWAREDLIPPYHIYLKMAYHLSQEARTGLREFRIRRRVRQQLFDFQSAAVKIAAHHLNKRGGVLIGDVVGLGKTLMATAVARIFEEDHDLETLIICPKNLVTMWQDYRDHTGCTPRCSDEPGHPGIAQPRRYPPGPDRREPQPPQPRRTTLPGHPGIHPRRTTANASCSRPPPTTRPTSTWPTSSGCSFPRTRTSASAPRPCSGDRRRRSSSAATSAPSGPSPPSRRANYADDWRELMRLYLVRRTRGFIQDNYAKTEDATRRKYLTFEDGRRSYFPDPPPRTVKFKIDDGTPPTSTPGSTRPSRRRHQHLNLPRYGWATTSTRLPSPPPPAAEAKVSQISRGPASGSRVSAGQISSSASKAAARRSSNRSSGTSSATASTCTPSRTACPPYRHAGRRTARRRASDDEDDDGSLPRTRTTMPTEIRSPRSRLDTEADFRRRAGEIYATYAGPNKKQFKWLRPGLFVDRARRTSGRQPDPARRLGHAATGTRPRMRS